MIPRDAIRILIELAAVTVFTATLLGWLAHIVG
jgi:hypothetical protein